MADVLCPQCGAPVQPSWDWCHACGFDPDGKMPAELRQPGPEQRPPTGPPPSPPPADFGSTAFPAGFAAAISSNPELFLSISPHSSFPPSSATIVN